MHVVGDTWWRRRLLLLVEDSRYLSDVLWEGGDHLLQMGGVCGVVINTGMIFVIFDYYFDYCSFV